MKRISLLLLLSLCLPFALYAALNAGADLAGGVLFAALTMVMAVVAWRG